MQYKIRKTEIKTETVNVEIILPPKVFKENIQFFSYSRKLYDEGRTTITKTETDTGHTTKQTHKTFEQILDEDVKKRVENLEQQKTKSNMDGEIRTIQADLPTTQNNKGFFTKIGSLFKQNKG